MNKRVRLRVAHRGNIRIHIPYLGLYKKRNYSWETRHWARMRSISPHCDGNTWGMVLSRYQHKTKSSYDHRQHDFGLEHGKILSDTWTRSCWKWQKRVWMDLAIESWWIKLVGIRPVLLRAVCFLQAGINEERKRKESYWCIACKSSIRTVPLAIRMCFPSLATRVLSLTAIRTSVGNGW